MQVKELIAVLTTKCDPEAMVTTWCPYHDEESEVIMVSILHGNVQIGTTAFGDDLAKD